MRRAVAHLTACAVMLIAASPLLGVGQEIASYTVLLQQDRGRPASPLERHVTVHLADVSLGQVLRTLEALGGVRVSFSSDIVPVAKQVSVDLDESTLREAFRRVLEGTGLEVLVQAGDHLVLVKSPSDPVQGGTVTGRVTDGKTGQPVAGASVLLVGTRWRATTGDDGRYRLVDVTAGTYVLTASRIGYAKHSQSVTVVGGQDAAMDLALQLAPSELEQVVVTGTLVPTERKALPTPISVITGDEIEQRGYRRMDQIFRGDVPGAIAWDPGSYDYSNAIAIRGASSLTMQTSAKVYVDGVETALAIFATIDPSSIDRIEVIRGPEAATLYGSDAIGGVIQVFTKHGDASLVHPEIVAKASVGAVQSQYESSSRQDYTLSARGGGAVFSYNVGGSYSHTGPWVPEYFSSVPSAFGAVQLTQGQLTVEVSGRHLEQTVGFNNPPALVQTGYFFYQKPRNFQTNLRQDTYGLRLTYTPVSWWQHHLIVGTDGYEQDSHTTAPRHTRPSDSLFSVYINDQRKSSIAYNTTVTAPISRQVTALLTGGVDRYAVTYNGFGTSSASDTVGTLQSTGPDSPYRLYSTNTGYFGQLQVNANEALFLTGGLRAEQNAGFGTSVGTPVSPRIGVAVVRQVGRATLKVRAAYGQAIKPPRLDQVTAATYSYGVQLANPTLGPERQVGGDGGVDLVFGEGRSLSVTYYNQIAKDLIQSVAVNDTSTPPTSQYQNLARVKNTGLEVEGRARVASLEFRAQYSITNSTVQDLGPKYGGSLRVGDQILGVPRHTASASLDFAPISGTTITARVVYVGTWTNTDYLPLYSCFAGTGACRPSDRDYWIQYPSFAKANLNLIHDIHPGLSGFLSIENITNTGVAENANYYPVQGRITMIGVRLVH